MILVAKTVALLALLTANPHDKTKRADLDKALDEAIPALLALRGKGRG